MDEIVLRPYQRQFIDDIRQEFLHGHKRVVGVAPCGAGKTIMTGWMIRESLKRDKSSIFFVHRKELIEQTADTFNRLHIPFGIIASGVKPNYFAPVQIASVQTLVNRLHLIPTPDFLICDECHHILADSYKKILDHWADSFLLGVTATPERYGGKRLGDIFNAMVFAPSVSELISLGNLTNFNYFEMDIVIDDELGKIKIKHGDYDIKGLSRLMDCDNVTSAIAESYLDCAEGKSAICYCVNVKHSQHVADYFNDVGIPAAHCDGNTPKDERKKIVDDFRRGKYKILCNANLFGEGFDVPNCHAVILARPTKSKILHIQQSMRSMRPDLTAPNKVAVIIDCVKNYKEHGYPDEPQDWSLDENDPKREGVAPFKFCPECNNQVPAPVEICPHCGHKFFEEVEVDATVAEQIYSSTEDLHTDIIKTHFNNLLARLKGNPKVAKPERFAAYQTVFLAKSFNDLVTLRILGGMKKGWEFFQAQSLNIPIPKKKVAKKPSVV